MGGGGETRVAVTMETQERGTCILTGEQGLSASFARLFRRSPLRWKRPGTRLRDCGSKL